MEVGLYQIFKCSKGASFNTTAWNAVKRPWPPDNEDSHKYAEHGSCLMLGTGITAFHHNSIQSVKAKTVSNYRKKITVTHKKYRLEPI
jgi:hypothetical protein